MAKTWSWNSQERQINEKESLTIDLNNTVFAKWLKNSSYRRNNPKWWLPIACMICLCMISHVQVFCNPMDCSLPGSPVHGFSQPSILEWVAISFFRGSSWSRDQTDISCIADSLLHCRGLLYWLSQRGSLVCLTILAQSKSQIYFQDHLTSKISR